MLVRLFKIYHFFPFTVISSLHLRDLGRLSSNKHTFLFSKEKERKLLQVILQKVKMNLLRKGVNNLSAIEAEVWLQIIPFIEQHNRVPTRVVDKICAPYCDVHAFGEFEMPVPWYLLKVQGVRILTFLLTHINHPISPAFSFLLFPLPVLSLSTIQICYSLASHRVGYWQRTNIYPLLTGFQKFTLFKTCFFFTGNLLGPINEEIDFLIIYWFLIVDYFCGFLYNSLYSAVASPEEIARYFFLFFLKSFTPLHNSKTSPKSQILNKSIYCKNFSEIFNMQATGFEGATHRTSQNKVLGAPQGITFCPTQFRVRNPILNFLNVLFVDCKAMHCGNFDLFKVKCNKSSFLWGVGIKLKGPKCIDFQSTKKNIQKATRCSAKTWVLNMQPIHGVLGTSSGLHIFLQSQAIPRYEIYFLNSDLFPFILMYTAVLFLVLITKLNKTQFKNQPEPFISPSILISLNKAVTKQYFGFFPLSRNRLTHEEFLNCGSKSSMTIFFNIFDTKICRTSKISVNKNQQSIMQYFDLIHGILNMEFESSTSRELLISDTFITDIVIAIFKGHEFEIRFGKKNSFKKYLHWVAALEHLPHPATGVFQKIYSCLARCGNPPNTLTSQFCLLDKTWVVFDFSSFNLFGHWCLIFLGLFLTGNFLSSEDRRVSILTLEEDIEDGVQMCGGRVMCCWIGDFGQHANRFVWMTLACFGKLGGGSTGPQIFPRIAKSGLQFKQDSKGQGICGTWLITTHNDEFNLVNFPNFELNNLYISHREILTVLILCIQFMNGLFGLADFCAFADAMKIYLGQKKSNDRSILKQNQQFMSCPIMMTFIPASVIIVYVYQLNSSLKLGVQHATHPLWIHDPLDRCWSRGVAGEIYKMQIMFSLVLLGVKYNKSPFFGVIIFFFWTFCTVLIHRILLN
ncbi:hypothetical protein VP01_641g1 [Puccinia sorghi]|uniref:Uncharacterized protein n=1 Tax=Puccinia sorghi TaxID=27349 RepID=A0A0L6UGN5_9BASI|nr:hypothetical protein VP01_641g1 [Puccinia sorghi]